MDRRNFIKTTAFATLAPIHCLPACQDPASMPIIDTHQHLWDLSMLDLRWLSPPIDRSFLMDDYLEAIAGQNVVKAIYMEVGAPPEQRKLEADWALELCRDPENSTVAAVIAKDPRDENFGEYMGSFEGSPYIKGIRHFFQATAEITDQKVIDNIRLLGDMGFSFDLGLPPRWLAAGSRLVDQCPGTPFVLNHCGSADPVAFFPEGRERPREPLHDRDLWMREIEQMARRSNVICKISGIVSRVPEYPLTAEDLSPIINHCLDRFGPDRVVFAGDWPVVLRNMSLSKWILTLKEVVASRSDEERRKLFHDNAEIFYGLSY